MNETIVSKIKLDSVDKVKSFVQKIQTLDCDVDIFTDRYIIDAKSIMGVFSLNLSKELNVRAYTDSFSTKKSFEGIVEIFKA